MEERKKERGEMRWGEAAERGERKEERKKGGEEKHCFKYFKNSSSMT